MSDALSGLLTEVIIIEEGSTASAASAIGATTIAVDNAGDYADGTVIQLTDDATTYTVAGDPANDVITITPALVTAVDEGDPIRILIAGQVASRTYAVVDLGGAGTDDTPGDTVRIPIVDQAQQAVYPEQQYSPPLPVTVAADMSAIIGTPSSRVPQTLDDVNTTATSAGQAASDAAAAAVAAQATADAAQTAVTSRGAVYWSSTAPSGGTYASTDVWFDAANGNRVNKWDGTEWVAEPFALAALAADVFTGTEFDGAIFNGGEFNGGTVVGAVYKTSGNATRIEISDGPGGGSPEILFYVAGITHPGAIDASAGGYLTMVPPWDGFQPATILDAAIDGAHQPNFGAYADPSGTTPWFIANGLEFHAYTDALIDGALTVSGAAALNDGLTVKGPVVTKDFFVYGGGMSLASATTFSPVKAGSGWTKASDTGNFSATADANGNFTCQVAGTYEINGAIDLGNAGATAGRAIVGVGKNTNATPSSPRGAATTLSGVPVAESFGPAVLTLAAGDTICMLASANTGSALTVAAANISIERIA